MKLTISVDGDPAAIEGILARIHEHLRGGEAVTFKSAIQPESNMGVEGFIEMQSATDELQAWKHGLDLLQEGRERLKLRGKPLTDWLKQRIKEMDISEEQMLPIFAQLYTMAKEEEEKSTL